MVEASAKIVGPERIVLEKKYNRSIIKAKRNIYAERRVCNASITEFWEAKNRVYRYIMKIRPQKCKD